MNSAQLLVRPNPRRLPCQFVGALRLGGPNFPLETMPLDVVRLPCGHERLPDFAGARGWLMPTLARRLQSRHWQAGHPRPQRQ